jgi:hypothetical protein
LWFFETEAGRFLAYALEIKECHWGYPEEFIHRPFGSYVRQAAGQQITNGLTAQMVFYRYDFIGSDGQPKVVLNASGRSRLIRLERLLCESGRPLVIEMDLDNPYLDELRRRHIMDELKKLGNLVQDEQVVVGRPLARGLDGLEAIEIQQNLMRQTKAGGSSAGAQTSRGSSGSMAPAQDSLTPY